MNPVPTFNRKNFKSLCDLVAGIDPDLENIINQYGYPPMWERSPGFATLVHIILEQQVSLASAAAAFTKLQHRLEIISPEALLMLTDEELKACYFSRQKLMYVKHLAQAISNQQLDLESLKSKTNADARDALTKIKGIGNWTADIYLMMAMQRADLFPVGDIALIASIRETKNIAKSIPKEEVVLLADLWKPYQTIAAYILWHAYLGRRKR